MYTKSPTFFLISSLLSATLMIAACHHDPMSPANGNPGGLNELPGSTGRNCSPDTVYFANNIFPLIQSTCTMSGCHDSKTRADGVDLTTYSNILKYVSVGNPTSSKIYREIVKTGSERMPPPPMPAWTSTQINLLSKWIQQGAKNNACDLCDTTNFAYSTAIKPLVTNKCEGCHNANNKSANLDLSTHTGLKAIALNGRLYGSITWSPGYSRMPSTLKLSDCEIRQVKKWIDAGSPNN